MVEENADEKYKTKAHQMSAAVSVFHEIVSYDFRYEDCLGQLKCSIELSNYLQSLLITEGLVLSPYFIFRRSRDRLDCG